MPNPIAYNPTALALLNGGETVQRTQTLALYRSLTWMEEGTSYPVSEVASFLPASPVRDAALSFAEAPGATFTYRLVSTAGGPAVPEIAFFREPAVVPVETPGPLVRTGGGGTPTPGGSVAVNLGGVTILVGASLLLSENDVPAPLIGPTMGTSYVIADGLMGGPTAPINEFFRGSLTAMGSATSFQYGWAYGLDALGVAPLGSDANSWGSVGGTLLTFAPAIESPLNPVFSATYANAFRSSIGVGLSGAGSGWLGSNIYLARGGWAGGAGWAGAGMQALGAAGAVLLGSSLGGWITEEMTGMNDESDPYGQLARMARDRLYSDAWGGLGRSPLGHIMAGLTVIFCGSDDFSEALGYAEDSIVRDARTFTDNLDPALLAILLNASSPNVNEPMGALALERGISSFYGDYSGTMTPSYRVIGILRRTHRLGDADGGITRFVDADGRIANARGLNTYAADMAERELARRTSRLESLFRVNGLVLRDGSVAPASGSSFSDSQIAFIRGEGARLTYEIVRLTNALATLRPSAVTAH